MTEIISSLLVIFFTFLEVLSRLTVWGHVVRIHFTAIFFIYLIFRTRHWSIAWLVFLHTIVVNPFTAYSFIQLLLSYVLVIGLVWRIREQIYTETYLTMSLWVFVLVLLHQLLLDFVLTRPSLTIIQLWGFVPLVVNCALSALMALPLFILLDRVFDTLGRYADVGHGFGRY